MAHPGLALHLPSLQSHLALWGSPVGLAELEKLVLPVSGELQIPSASLSNERPALAGISLGLSFLLCNVANAAYPRAVLKI